MYVRFGKRIWDIAIGLIALPFVLLARWRHSVRYDSPSST